MVAYCSRCGFAHISSSCPAGFYYKSNQERLDAMVYKIAPWAPNPREFNKAAYEVALALLERVNELASALCACRCPPEVHETDGATCPRCSEVLKLLKEHAAVNEVPNVNP